MKRLIVAIAAAIAYLSILLLVFQANSPNPTTANANNFEFPISFVSLLPDGQVGVPYIPVSILASGQGPYICHSETPLPIGLSIDGDAYLSGVPAESGIFGVAFKCLSPSSVGYGSLSLTINPAQVVATDKRANVKGIITEIDYNFLVVDTITVYLTPEVKTKLKQEPELEIGQEVHFKGVLNTDNSVTASEIKVD